MSPLDELMESLERKQKEPSKPGGWYSNVGDCVFCFAEDVPHHAERVDRVLTVYRSDDDDRIVGVQVKHISQLPRHDLMQIRFGTTEGVDVVQLIALSLRTEAKPAPDKAAKYIDAIASMVGQKIVDLPDAA